MKYNPDIHHRRSIRLQHYDYMQAGAYFVTICVQGRECLFGEIAYGTMRLHDAGRMVQRIWGEIPDHYPGIDIDAFVVMPNHIHGIVIITENTEHCDRQSGQAQGPAPTKSLALSDIVKQYKPMTINQYIRGVRQNGWPPFPGRLWQRNYWEHVVRDESELQQIREYIRDNPANWASDQLHSCQGTSGTGTTREPVPGYRHCGQDAWMV